MEEVGKGTTGRIILTNKINVCPHDVWGGAHVEQGKDLRVSL